MFRNLATAVVVLDRDLKVKVFNSKAEDLRGSRADEVVGRSFLGLDIGLPVVELCKPVRRLLRGDEPRCEQMVQALTRRGKAIRCQVTCAPLLGEGRAVDGAILVMEEWHQPRGDP